ncbi:hypothetical protein DMUE_3308 [Dictyocoela muelleri]|nr:hypothetical protein DMUE_3308 [Dictyocoela muelleri]
MLFLVPVLNRNAETMRTIIVNNVHPGTTIITDQWRGYSAALRNSVDFTHRSVNHSINFVDPDDPIVHTQSIEGLWGYLKRFLRERSKISQFMYSEYLIQFL